MLDRMSKTVVDSDMLADREAERAALIDALEKMTNLARQWERFNGTPASTTPEIEEAIRLIKEARKA
jgi:hypothetical protein